MKLYFVFVCFLSWPAHADLLPTCQERARLFSDSIRKAEADSTESLLASLIQTKAPRLVVFGEKHLSRAEPKIYPALIQAVKMQSTFANRKTCLFLEAKSEKGIKATVSKALRKAYAEQSLELIPVDDPANQDLDQRNFYIAHQIDGFFESNHCDQGILIIGSAHLEDVGNGSLQNLLHASSVFIDIVSTDFHAKRAQNPTALTQLLGSISNRKDVIWPQCQPNENADLDAIAAKVSSKTSSTIAIDTSQIKKVPIYASHQMLDPALSGPFWSTYDLLVIYSPL